MQTAPTAMSIAKLALYIALLILPGGSLIALVVWWVSRRWGKSAVHPAYVRPAPVS
jgi:hypothetical protein